MGRLIHIGSMGEWEEEISVYVYEGSNSEVGDTSEVNIETDNKNNYYSVQEAKELIALLQQAVDKIEGNDLAATEEGYRVETQRTAGKFATVEEELTMLCMGLAGESGEVVDTIKKVVFHGHPLDIDELKKELGDTHWYFTRLMDTLGIDPKEVRQLNVEKLRKRYPQGFSSEDSIKRVDNN
ncbi:nucleotide pyrophosphohydrolase domain protein [Bacillus phage DZ1]|uniref:Nucleotide pyrophosphohydrolase domain protein n=1 Tax=Bacillus phage DZ1 TaxID=3075862 RepID=A0AA96EQX8_9CAUD|nr:nucleotide pyrophosphohydrolase domain protein [Bacillus phage DZ1]